MTTAKNQNKDAEKKTKTTAKKTTAKKATTKKTVAKKTTAKKPVTKKTTGKKTVAEKELKQAAAVTPEVKEIKPEILHEVKPAPKAEVQTQVKPEVKQETKPVQKEQQKAPVSEDKPKEKVIKILGQPTIKELAEKMDFKINDFIKKLMGMGIFATINQKLDLLPEDSKLEHFCERAATSLRPHTTFPQRSSPQTS